MLNQIKNQIESAINFCKQYDCDYFVVLRNPDNVIKHWKMLHYDVQYDMECFDDIDCMFDFINGKSTYNYIDNSTSLKNGMALYYGTKNGEIISLM